MLDNGDFLKSSVVTGIGVGPLEDDFGLEFTSVSSSLGKMDLTTCNKNTIIVISTLCPF